MYVQPTLQKMCDYIHRVGWIHTQFGIFLTGRFFA